MSGYASKKVQLTVVKSATSRSIFTSQDALTAEQLELLREYMQRSGVDGVCAGALVGAERWDLRPVVIEKGQLTITRFTPSEGNFQSRNFAAFQAYQSRIAGLTLPGRVSSGSSHGQLWMRRRFYRHTLAELSAEVAKQTKLERLTRIQKIVALVKQLHSNNLFHGNIVAPNLAWPESDPVLLDFGFNVFQAASERKIVHPAGEVADGGFGPHTDMFCLGMLMATMFADELSAEEERFIESLLSSNIALRPTITQMEEFLVHRIAATGSTNAPQTSAPETSDPNRIKTGPPIIRLTQEYSHASNTHNLEFHGRPLPFQTGQKIPRPSVFQSLELSGGVLLAALAVVIGAYLYFVPGYLNAPNEPQSAIESPDKLWRSGQPSLMQQVARAAATQNDAAAQLVIIQEVLSGKQPHQVRTDLIRTVFDPRWEAELNETDRELALKLALGALVPDALNTLPPLSDAHPAVIYGVLGSLSLETEVPQLAQVPVINLAKLPAPFGPVFGDLKPLGIYSGQDLSIRALCHLLQGKISDNNVARYFDQANDDLVTFIKLRALMPAILANEQLQESVHLFLFTNSSLFALMMRWFEEEPLADWSKLTRPARMALLSGIFPAQSLTFEQYADLLTFPNERVRKTARGELSTRYFKGKMTPLLAFLGSSQNHLSRSQTISITAAFLMTGPQADAFYKNWFDGKPDPNTVVAMLLERSNAGLKDLFNFKAAAYLNTVAWDAPLDVLKKLVIHPEPLARSLGYVRLDKNKPDELRILRARAAGETDKLLKEYLRQKLAK